MNLFDFHKTIVQSSVDNIKRLSVFNPLTIRKKGTRSKAVFALALVCILWGTTWIASKEGVSHMPALQLAGIRQLIAGSLYVGFFLYKRFPLPKGKEWIPVIVLSFLNFIMSNGLSTWGVQYISAGLGSIMGAIFPLWLVVIGLFISSEKLPRKAVIGLLLGFSGVCIIFYDHLHDFLNPDFLKGIILSLIATWTWAFATLYTKTGSQFQSLFQPRIANADICLHLNRVYQRNQQCHTNQYDPLAILGFNWLSSGLRFADCFYLLLICPAKSSHRTGIHLCIYQPNRCCTLRLVGV